LNDSSGSGATAVRLGERAVVTPAEFRGLVGVAETAGTVRELGFLPLEPLPAEGRPPLLDADRFLERAFELAIAGRLPLLSSAVIAGRAAARPAL
jgi:hypothetical protein